MDLDRFIHQQNLEHYRKLLPEAKDDAQRQSLLKLLAEEESNVQFDLPESSPIVESEKAYEITAELPGMDEKNIEVKVANGNLIIKGERQEEKEEKEKDYYLRERNFGSFERSFDVPEGVDGDKIEASFRKGVLTVTLPKKPEAQKPAKKIEVKAA